MSTLSTELVKQRRAGVCAPGLRPNHIWMPQARRAGFETECYRQTRVLQDEWRERETPVRLAAVADTESWR